MATHQQLRDAGFYDGYQAALRDLAEQNDDGGVHAVFVWIFNNARDERVRHLVRHLVNERGE